MKHRDVTLHAQGHTSNRWWKQDLNSGNLAWEFIIYFYLFIWLCWVFRVWHRLSLVVASGDCSSSRCGYSSLWWLLLLWNTGSVVATHRLQNAGSVVMMHRLSCSVAFGNFLDQRLNLCFLHWKVDSYPTHYQGNPRVDFFNINSLNKHH